MLYSSFQSSLPGEKIRLRLEAPLEADLFSTQAEQCAVRCRSRNKNATAQIRRFYDELLLWNDQVQIAADKQSKFEEVYPYIQMLRAKVAYARARRLVDDNFQDIFEELIGKIRSPQSLENAKLFFEAMLGFRKYYEECGGKR